MPITFDGKPPAGARLPGGTAFGLTPAISGLSKPFSSSSSLFRLMLATVALATMEYAAALEASGYAMAVSLFATRRLALPVPRRRPSRRGEAGNEAVRLADLRDAARLAAAHPAAEAHLVCLGDKTLLFSQDRRAFIMYARQNRQLIALFDPVGPQGLWHEVIGAFLALARQEKCRPVFYQASESFLHLAEGYGMRGYKLGERADIDVSGFDMKGKDWANLRRAVNRAERDGLSFERVEAENVEPLLPELVAISDAWLLHTGTKEKRFSLGRFDAAYLSAHPLGVMCFDGRIVAFANIMQDDEGKHAFIDLMRFLPGVHRGTMDLLMVRIIEMLKARGVRWLNLGMAPLSGLSDANAASPLWNRAGRLIFRHGGRFYNFEGLRAFKEKFDPRWKTRYLVVPKNANPFVSAAAAAVLIAGGWRGLVGR